jgi:hypothetical protein
MRTFALAGTASLLVALFSATAFAADNPNVSRSSPYAIGGYDIHASLGLGSGFRDAAAPGVLVGAILTPLTMVPVIVNGMAPRGL